jgi:hypothetical protein
MDSTGDFTMSRFTRSPLTWALAAFLGMLGFQAGTYVGSLPSTAAPGPTGAVVSLQLAPRPTPLSPTLVSGAPLAPPASASMQR